MSSAFVEAADTKHQGGESISAGDSSVAAPGGRRRGTRPALRFAGGFAGGFALHEGAHAATAILFGAEPGLKGIRFGPLPFFAVTHRSGLTPRREALISGAGFFSQHLMSEWILTARPRLRDERAPGSKGALAFHAVTSLGYAVAAALERGPKERDTRSLAEAARLREPLVGALVLAPLALDAWRYWRPDSRTARWASRASKVAFAVVALRQPKP
jgi:hypothetical protein